MAAKNGRYIIRLVVFRAEILLLYQGGCLNLFQSMLLVRHALIVCLKGYTVPVNETQKKKRESVTPIGSVHMVRGMLRANPGNLPK